MAPSIEQLEGDLRRSQLELRLNVARKQLKLSESFFHTPLVGEVINPLEQLYDGDRLLYPIFPTRRDSSHVNNLFQSEAQLDLQRAYARYLYDSNSYASGAVEGLANYVIFKGYDYNVTPKKNASDTLKQQAQDILDEFVEANDWPEYERELFKRSRRDGDAILRLFPQEEGPTLVRVVEPEQVRAPNQSPEWAFGVHTAEDDLLTILGYWVTYTADPKDGEEVDACEIVHIKVNADKNSRRGISDFFCVGQELESAKKLLRNAREGESVRSAIAYLREHQMADQSTIQALQEQNADSVLSYTQPITNRTVTVQRVEPGSVQDIPQGLTHKSIPAYLSAPAVELVSATLEAVAVRWQAPVWLVSGNASNTNFASALTAESPFTMAVESAQSFYQRAYKKVMWRVLEIAVEQGRLPEKALQVLSLQVEAPPITPRNKAEENTINTTLSEKGLLSDQTWSTREGLDYEQEQANRKEEQAEKILPPPAPLPTSVTVSDPSNTPSAVYSQETQRSSLS